MPPQGWLANLASCCVDEKYVPDATNLCTKFHECIASHVLINHHILSIIFPRQSHTWDGVLVL